MKPAPFDYLKPATIGEASLLLAEHPDDAKIIAGGQSLVPLMNFRLARPRYLIDLNSVAGLDYIRDEGEWIAIGAMTREKEIERSPLIAEQLPLLAEATHWIGHPPIRSRGTIGGSIAHNDPSAEYPLVATALGAEVVAQGSQGARRIPIADLLVTYLTTSLAHDELLSEVRFPKLPAGAGWSFQEMARRRGDFAIVATCAVLVLEQGTVSSARIAIGGAAPVAFRATDAEQMLLGERVTPALIQAAASRAAEMCEPDADVHASVEYRQHLAEVLTRRALAEAHARAE